VNTGMNRLGLQPSKAAAALDQLRQHSGIRSVTLMTHFANADDAKGVAWQLEALERVVGPTDLPRSFANSAAVMRYPETHADWIRPGIMLYGCSPFADQSAEQLGLKPVMTLTSELIATHHLQAGERVGYGFGYTAAGEMTIGIIACGYGDGYPRHASTGTPVLVNGKRVRMVGRVSMDMIAVDITDVPDAYIGSPVTLWGEGLSADEIGAAADTLSYELLCKLTARVPVAEVA